MKSGASDPFSDGDGTGARDESTNDRSAAGRARGRDQSPSPPEADPRIGEGDGSEPADKIGSDASTSTGSDEDVTADLDRSDLPYVLRRERVKDERPEVHQLFVRRSTHDRAIDAERTLQDRLDDDLSRTDAREAIYLAGMAHLDDAESILRSWGYDL